MALNQNHTIEELGGTRCSIVEKNITQARVDFLTALLTGNGYTVVCAEAAPPKAKAAPAAAAPAEGEATAEAPKAPEVAAEPAPAMLFTLGVTDFLFNPINAVFGRLLKAPNGHFVTPAYWHQEEALSHDEIPYYEHKNI